MTAEQALHKKADRADIVQTANNLLVRAGYTDPLWKTGRPSKRDEPIPVRLLQTNYQRMLNSRCGLSDDPDTASFLSGLQFQSSTYTNYESHTSPEAQYRLYTILQPLSVEHKLRKPKELRNTKDGQIYTAGPGTNHEVAQVFGRIQLPPGESITIRCPHGVTGSIKFQKKQEEKNETFC